MRPAIKVSRRYSMLSAVLLAAPVAGWVTQMQSKYGVSPADVGNAWDGIESASGPYGTMGWYWHMPEKTDDNRGLGCAARGARASASSTTRRR